MRRLGSLLAVIVVSTFVASSACSSSVSPIDPGPTDGGSTDVRIDPAPDAGAPTADQACTELAAAYCDRSFACAALYSDITYADPTTCKTRLKASCLGTFSTPGVAELPPRASACAKQVNAAPCEDLLAKKQPSNCVPVPGAVANGGACGDREQCASGFCVFATDSICGACAAVPSAGDDCNNKQCGAEMTCIAGSGKCQRPGLLGDACSTRDTPCAPGLSCFSGKCVKGGGPGAGCDKVEVDAPDCDGTQGVFCNTTTKVCQKALEAKAGETCGLAGSDYKLCVGGSICKLAAGSFSGTCIAPAADGAACSAGSDGPGCLYPAFCIGGVCKLADGKSCVK